MTEINWTDYPGILPLPQLSGFGYKSVSGVIRTQMVSGYTRKRNRTLNAPTRSGSVVWKFTNDQLAIFESWWRNELKNGAKDFSMLVKTPRGLQRRICSFEDEYAVSVISSEKWTVKTKLSIREMPKLEPDLTRLVIETNETASVFNGLPDVLSDALNNNDLVNND